MVTECVRCINNIKLVYNMPRKSKKLRFGGVAKQFLSELPEDINNPASSQRKPTASEKKLADANAMDECTAISSSVVDDSQRTTGYRLLDLECMSEAMSRLHTCEEGKQLFLYLYWYIPVV